MDLEHHLAWRANTKGRKYEDRFLIPLGELPERLEEEEDPAESRRLTELIESRKSRGLVFAVLDGVGSAPLGMAAAQATVDQLRSLYSRPELAPCNGFPGPEQVLDLIHRANEEVHGWGLVEEAGGAKKPKGAACLSAMYVSPGGVATLFQAGDTAAFVHRAASGKTNLFTGADEVAGKAVSNYVGLGPRLAVDTLRLEDLQPGDFVALVSDGVFPKGFRTLREVEALLRDADGNPEYAAEQLMGRSASRGVDDDITALVVAFG